MLLPQTPATTWSPAPASGARAQCLNGYQPGTALLDPRPTPASQDPALRSAAARRRDHEMAHAPLPLPLPDNPSVEPLTARLEDLLRQIALGDVQAFEVVYARVSGPIYGLTRRVLRDPAQAEEVTQEVLLWVWREATRFDETHGSAMAWMMTVAHRRAVDRVRSEESTTARHRRAAQLCVEWTYDEVSENVLTQLDREAVRRALFVLTPAQRESVTLAYYDGYTYREVAEILGLPLGTAKTRIRDGLLRMRDHLNVTAQRAGCP